MAVARRNKIDERKLQGVRQLEKLLPLVERLHGVGCERDTAGNRQLFMDQYCLLILLYFFNPIVTSLRGIQQASELKKVQRRLGCPRASLGSLSEATQVFRTDLLAEIVGELVGQLGKLPHDGRLDAVTQRLTAVDGTLLAKLPQITQAAWHSRRHPDGWRLHTHFEVLRGAAVRVALTDGRNRESSNEKSVLRTMLQPDRCYILDRGYEQFSLFNAIVASGSSYVCRIRGDHHFAARAVLPLSDAASRAGVVEDAIGVLGSPRSERIEHPDHSVRVVRIQITRHPKRGSAAIEDITLATNLLDVPADVIALMYQHRWTIELFFRFFKHVLGCRHLLSHDRVGIEIQTYCAIIVCLLVSLWTGRKPTSGRLR
jgi:Transposase DDE domain